MPKIIKNLNEKIISICTNLFGSHGYENVEMKMIAKECNVAVGTLYNYYNSKWNIYEEVLNLFWSNVEIRIDELISSKESNENKAKELVKLLEKELNHNSSLCEAFFKTDMQDIDYNFINNTKMNIINKISLIIKPLLKKSINEKYNNCEDKISELILISLTYYKSDFKEKCDFMYDIFVSSI